MSKKVVIFDFDGTIADTFDLSLDMINSFLSKFGIKKVDVNKVRSFQKKFLSRGLIRVLKFPFWLILHFSIGVFQRRLQKKVKDIKVFDNIPEILEELKEKNIRVGIVTNNLKKTVKKFLVNNSLESRFEFIYSSKLVLAKTHAFKKVFKKYNINKKDVIYVGDEVRDIGACQDAGIAIISVCWGYDIKESLAEEKPDWLVSNTRQLKNLLKDLTD